MTQEERPTEQIAATEEARRERYLLVAILLLASFLRLFALGKKSLGVDESFSVLLAERPLREVWTGDLHPPLYHLLLYCVTFLGTSEWVVRLPSALSGIVAVPLAFELLKSLGHRKAGLWAAALVAVSPVHIHHSQEARMYSFLVLWCLGSLYYLVGLIRTGKAASSVGYVLTTILSLYTHNLAWAVVVAGWAIVVSVEGLQGIRRRPFWLSQLAIALLYLPWIGGLRHHVTSISSPQLSGDWGKAAGAAFVSIANFLCGYFYYLQECRLEICCAVVMVLSAYVCARGFIPRAGDRLLNSVLICSLVVPFAMSAGLTWKTGMAQSKYYITALLPLMMVLGCGLERLRLKRSPLLPLYLSLLLFLIVCSLWRYLGPAQLGRDDWRGIHQYVEECYQPGDLVVFNGPWSFYSFDYYSRGRLPRLGMPRQSPPTMLSVSREFEEVRHAGYRRAILIVSPGSQIPADPGNLVFRWLKQQRFFLQERRFGEITVWLFGLQQRQSAQLGQRELL